MRITFVFESTMLRNRICPCFLTDCSKVTRPSMCGEMVWMGPVYSICIKYSGNFVHTLVLHGDSILLYKPVGLHLCDFNFYVMGKKYMLSLLPSILVLCTCLESSKITSYFELFWTKYFHFGWQNVSSYFSRVVNTDWQIIHIFTEY